MSQFINSYYRHYQIKLNLIFRFSFTLQIIYFNQIIDFGHNNYIFSYLEKELDNIINTFIEFICFFNMDN